MTTTSRSSSARVRSPTTATDIEVYSPQSPLGAALDGHKAGETVDFEQPNGKVAKIEIISAVPFSG